MYYISIHWIHFSELSFNISSITHHTFPFTWSYVSSVPFAGNIWAGSSIACGPFHASFGLSSTGTRYHLGHNRGSKYPLKTHVNPGRNFKQIILCAVVGRKFIDLFYITAVKAAEICLPIRLKPFIPYAIKISWKFMYRFHRNAFMAVIWVQVIRYLLN